MRNRNSNPARALQVEEGRQSPRNAGTRGITIRDKSTEAHPVRDVLFVGATVTDVDDGVAIVTVGGSVTVVGEVTPDGTPFTISSGADFRGFPGVAWLTDPTATVHGVGDKFLIVYYHGATHLTVGTVVGRIGTITATVPWTYTVGAEFNIDTTNTPRCDDAVSVLDIGGGDYRAVVADRELTGLINHTPHVLVCDDPAATMTSGSGWSRYDIALSGHTQDFNVGRVHKLANGRFMVAYGYISGATHVNGVAWTTDITDWSAPTFVPINSSTSALDEFDFEEVSSGTLYANLRNDATAFIDSSVSTDSGDTWSTPAAMFAGTYFPTWRLLNSGIGLITYADTATASVVYRQTTSGLTDSGWGAETVLDAGGAYISAYATILQLDNSNVLVIYGLESTEPDPVDSDLYSQVLFDSSVIGTSTSTDLDGLTDVTITSPAEDDQLQYIGGEWVNNSRRWEAVTNGEDVFVWESDDLVHEWKAY